MDTIKEYDIFVSIKKEDIHTLCYIVEAEDNLMNIRHVSEKGLLKIIVPADLKDETISFLNHIREYLNLEVVEIRENPGHT